jgi:N-succinyldiaminopimelate aminotransferase
LRQAIASHYGRWHGLNLDPMTEVMVTSGGTEALTSSILAVVEPGDEVVCFQPVYDSYLPIIRQAGGIPRLLRLEPPDWRLSEEMLRSVFNHKTKAVLFNNPLNPAAVVYPREDLELLARFCQEFDTVAICDEVWEHVTFDGREHIPLITIPGMRDRTIKVGSAGKIFSLTGWKIGFVCAAPPLLRVAAKVHQFLTFTSAPNLQAAVAYGLGKPAEYFYEMRKDLARSRDRLTKGLESIGFPVLKSQGTYFLTVDVSPLGLNETDVEFCKRIVTDYKVAAIPVSAFYEQDAVTSVVRFCFSKKDATLDTALERLSDAVHRRKR